MKYLKKTLLLLSLFLISNFCIAQTGANDDYGKFVNYFRSTIGYPTKMFKNCTSTICLLKVQLDSFGKVTDLQLSDSADSIFNVEFRNDKQKLDTKLLENYIKTKYPNNTCTTYLIPLSYSPHQMPCPTKSVDIAILYNFTKFNGEFFTGNVIFLNPIYTEMAVQR